MQFWLENPNVILKHEYLTELWPDSGMNTTRKMNAMSRLILILTCIGLFVSKQKEKVGITGVTSLAAIAALYYYKERAVEGFTESECVSNEHEEVPVEPAPMRIVDTRNPFQNVMVPEYGTNAAEREAIREEDLEDAFDNVKKNTVRLFQNDDEIEDEDVKSKLFSSLGDNYMFASSMRNYASNPNMGVMNNQNAFAEFCYGKMSSIKENGIHPQ